MIIGKGVCICDRCGKMLQEKNREIRRGTYKDFGINSMGGISLVAHRFELCIDCNNKLIDFIKHRSAIISIHDLRKLEDLTEKEKPKKAFWMLDKCSPNDDLVKVCPNCKQRIVNVWSIADYKPKYCHYCGQHLDWSAEDDR